MPAAIEPLQATDEPLITADIVKLEPVDVLLEDRNFRALLAQVGALVRPGHDLVSDVLTRNEWQTMDRETVFGMSPLLGKVIPSHLSYEIGEHVAMIARRTAEAIATRADVLANSLNMGGAWGGERRSGRPPASFKPDLRKIYEEWELCALLLKKFKRLNQLQVRECLYPFALGHDGDITYGFKIVDEEPRFIDVERESGPAPSDGDTYSSTVGERSSWWRRLGTALGLNLRSGF